MNVCVHIFCVGVSFPFSWVCTCERNYRIVWHRPVYLFEGLPERFPEWPHRVTGVLIALPPDHCTMSF